MMTEKLQKTILYILLLIAPYFAFADDEDEIAKAVSEGNCEILFNFVQNPEGKDRKLIDSATNTIAYDAETFLGKASRGQDYISVIKNKKAICGGYSELFNNMCALASVESIAIHGYSKGYGYNGTGLPPIMRGTR